MTEKYGNALGQSWCPLQKSWSLYTAYPCNAIHVYGECSCLYQNLLMPPCERLLGKPNSNEEKNSNPTSKVVLSELKSTYINVYQCLSTFIVARVISVSRVFSNLRIHSRFFIIIWLWSFQLKTKDEQLLIMHWNYHNKWSYLQWLLILKGKEYVSLLIDVRSKTPYIIG